MKDCFILQHSIECGAGTGIFLLVNSSIIVVIRGPRAALWGSVYLDEHGEEDRDLKLDIIKLKVVSKAFQPKNSNINQYYNESFISGTSVAKIHFCFTESIYIAIKGEWWQMLKFVKKILEVIDLLRYWPMLQIFGRKALEVD